MIHANYQRFSELCQAAGLREASVKKSWGELLSHYFEPHRHDHTLKPINKMLDCLDSASMARAGIVLAT